MHVGPTRSLKSYTLNEVIDVFSNDFWIDLGSDFSLPSLQRYRDRIMLGVCFLVNDAVLLLSSKIARARNRIIGGFSELLSDARYTYQDFLQKLQLKGKVTSIWNITSESYQYNKDFLFGATFSERFLTVHYAPTKEE